MNGMFSSLSGAIVRETSNFLVEEKVLSASASTLTFSNLDGLTDGGYALELLTLGDGTARTFALYVNGDNTDANYYTEQVFLTGTTVAGANYAASYVGWNGAASSNKCYVNMDIQLVNGFVRMASRCVAHDGTTYYNRNYAVFHNTQIPNISQLSLVSPGVFPAGTVARLYRKKQGTPSAFPTSQGSTAIPHRLTTTRRLCTRTPLR